jgi:PAS domain S-box-containing protein
MNKSIQEKLEGFLGDRDITSEELLHRISMLDMENVQFRHETRECLLQCETKYQAILDTVDTHISLVDSDMKILWANKKAMELFGRDMVGKHCCEAYYGTKETCSNSSSCITKQAFQKGNAKRKSTKMITRGGVRMFFEGIARVVSRDRAGNPTAVVKIYKDITKRMLAQEELRNSMQQLRKNLANTIQAMARTVETRDAYTAGHQKRTTDIASAIAFEMGLSKETIDGIRMAGVIHDLGKISIPAEILSKPGIISDSEFSLIKQHPQSGFEILKGIDFKWPVADIVLQHHERINGSGYPYGRQGDDILLEARVIGVADVIEAMASHRPYRPALGIDDAFEEITTNSGVLYEPDVVDAAVDLFTRKGYQLH